MGWADTLSKGQSKTDAILEPNTTKQFHILLEPDEEPYSYWTHYIPNKGGGAPRGFVVICPGKNICPACKVKSYRTTMQHAINVWDYSSNSVKILRQGNSVMSQLKLIHDQYKTWDHIDISIRRIGDGQGTQYIVVPIPRQEIFNEDITNKLHIIPEVKHANTPEEIQQYIDGITVDTNFNPEEFGKKEEKRSGQFVMPFGKYKGQTLIDIYKKDTEYIGWLAENMSDQYIKEEAKKVINTVSSNNQELSTTDLIIYIQNEIQHNPQYSGNYDLVVNRMKEASKSSTHPNGKTLLDTFTTEELNKLLHSL